MCTIQKNLTPKTTTPFRSNQKYANMHALAQDLTEKPANLAVIIIGWGRAMYFWFLARVAYMYALMPSDTNYHADPCLPGYKDFLVYAAPRASA